MRLTIKGDPWIEKESFLDSTEDSPDFVVDTANDGRGVLRFGDGRLGKALPQNPAILATYRIGNGASGNVGAGVLTEMVIVPAGVLSVRNPLPAIGGIDPEPIVEVQRDAPQEFSAVQYRAVTISDYAKAAAGVAGVSSAAAVFRWTGSWLTVFVAVDPIGREDLPPALKQAVVARLDSYRQAGYDLEVQPPLYVPLEIELEVCVLPDYFQADVQEAVLDALSSGMRRDGRPGFFFPDQFTFGQSLYLSRLYAVVQGIEGVRAVHAKVFKRLNQPDYGELAAGVLATGAFEIVRLDNDPSLPDNGILTLDMEDGK
jgi:predicted phage baseplate assembly protein